MVLENITAMHIRVFEKKQRLSEIKKSIIHYVGNFKQTNKKNPIISFLSEALKKMQRRKYVS